MGACRGPAVRRVIVLAGVVADMVVVAEEVRVVHQERRRREAADAQDARRSTCAWLERRTGALVDPANALLDAHQRRFVDQVGLVQHDAVGGQDLVDRLVVVVAQQRVVEVAFDVSASISVTTPSSRSGVPRRCR